MNDVDTFLMPFGKHKGKTLGWIAENDVLYLDWLVGSPDLRGPLRDAVEQMCETWAREIDLELERHGR